MVFPGVVAVTELGLEMVYAGSWTRTERSRISAVSSPKKLPQWYPGGWRGCW